MGSFDWSIIYEPAFLRQLRIPNAADRDDAIQDACVKLLKKPVVTPRLLLKTIVNCYKDYVKGESRRKAREQLRAIPEVCENRNPCAKLERREARAAIKRAIRSAGLSRDYLCVLLASLRGSGSLAEFARRRGISPNTVRTWAKRARDMLRPHLRREGLGPD